MSSRRRKRLVTKVTRVRRGRRRGTLAEARARYERAAEAMEGCYRTILEFVAKMGSLAFMDGDLWHRCWDAHDRFISARTALWVAEHGPGDQMGWAADLRGWR